MSKDDNITMVEKLLLGSRMHMSSDVTLSPRHSKYMLSKINREANMAKVKVLELDNLSDVIEDRLSELDEAIPEADAKLEDTKAKYAKADTPADRRKWAQRLIVNNGHHQYLCNTKETLGSTVKRIKDAVEDAQTIYEMSKQQARDAEIYFRLNGGLRLVGQALQAARTHRKLPEIEAKNLEYTLERVEEEITTTDTSDLLLEANNIMGANQ
jgi:hypothetical protein